MIINLIRNRFNMRLDNKEYSIWVMLFYTAIKRWFLKYRHRHSLIKKIGGPKHKKINN